MNDKHAYLNLGFLDFLVYYVPGIFVILFLIALNLTFNLEIENVGFSIQNMSGDTYVRGAIWTILSLIIPYVLGHLVFPAGNFVGRIFLRNNQLEDNGKNENPCERKQKKWYCEMESFDFARCLFQCFRTSNSNFNDLMITRFRTLSRFCRSMLLPSILFSASFALFAIMLLEKKNARGAIGLFFLGIAVLYSFVGLGSRYRKYEMRWRNGICIGSLKAEQEHNTLHPLLNPSGQSPTAQ